jgi:hypothetical protein
MDRLLHSQDLGLQIIDESLDVNNIRIVFIVEPTLDVPVIVELLLLHMFPLFDVDKFLLGNFHFVLFGP